MIRPQYRSGQYFRENTGNHLDIFVKKIFLIEKPMVIIFSFLSKTIFMLKRLKFVCVHGEKLLEPGKKLFSYIISKYWNNWSKILFQIVIHNVFCYLVLVTKLIWDFGKLSYCKIILAWSVLICIIMCIAILNIKNRCANENYCVLKDILTWYLSVLNWQSDVWWHFVASIEISVGCFCSVQNV